VPDLLLRAGQAPLRMAAPRVHTRNVHGTGCTLSSAIACHLALGHALDEAVRLARGYVSAALAAGADVHTGHGHGPLNHAHAPLPMRKIAHDDPPA